MPPTAGLPQGLQGNPHVFSLVSHIARSTLTQNTHTHTPDGRLFIGRPVSSVLLMNQPTPFAAKNKKKSPDLHYIDFRCKSKGIYKYVHRDRPGRGHTDPNPDRNHNHNLTDSILYPACILAKKNRRRRLHDPPFALLFLYSEAHIYLTNAPFRRGPRASPAACRSAHY